MQIFTVTENRVITSLEQIVEYSNFTLISVPRYARIKITNKTNVILRILPQRRKQTTPIRMLPSYQFLDMSALKLKTKLT